MVLRVRLRKPTASEWYGPVRLAIDAGAIATCVAMLGFPVLEWPAAVGIACFTAAAHHARVAFMQYRQRRQ